MPINPLLISPTNRVHKGDQLRLIQLRPLETDQHPHQKPYPKQYETHAISRIQTLRALYLRVRRDTDHLIERKDDQHQRESQLCEWV